LNSILAELGKIRNAYSSNFADIFKIAKDGGVFRSVRLSPEALKDRLGGVSSIIIDPSITIEVDERLFNQSDLSAGYIMIHELFHAAVAAGSWYNHTEMATAAYNV